MILEKAGKLYKEGKNRCFKRSKLERIRKKLKERSKEIFLKMKKRDITNDRK